MKEALASIEINCKQGQALPPNKYHTPTQSVDTNSFYKFNSKVSVLSLYDEFGLILKQGANWVKLENPYLQDIHLLPCQLHTKIRFKLTKFACLNINSMCLKKYHVHSDSLKTSLKQ